MSLLAAVLCGCAAAPPAVAPDGTGSGPVVLALAPYAGTELRTVNVSINGAPPIPFIFDTGAGSTVLDLAGVPAAGCIPFGQSVGFRADGTPLRLKRCGPVALELGGLRTSRELEIFDLRSLLHGAPPVGGLVGLDAFDGRAITLDWAHDRIIVETPASLAERVRGMVPLVARITREPNGARELFLQAKAKVGTLWLELDTGNDGPVFLDPHAAEQLGVTLEQGARVPATLELPGLGAVPVTAARREMIYDGQLNPAFARRFVLTVDLAHDRVWGQLQANGG